MAAEERPLCSESYMLLSPLFIIWGLVVLLLSLATLAFTSSYRTIFPSFAPVWTSTLFLVAGCFLFFTYKMSKHIPLSHKSHVWMSLSLGVVAVCESVLAFALSLWHYLVLSSYLSLCSPDPTRVRGGGYFSCECTKGFINPPSLIRPVYRFEGVTDCEVFGGSLRIVYNVFTGLYLLGVVLAVLLCIGAGKRLHSLGVCRESGVYTVTPAASITATLRQSSPDQLSPFTRPPSRTARAAYRSPLRTSQLPPVSNKPLPVVVGCRHRLTSTGSTYQSAMI